MRSAALVALAALTLAASPALAQEEMTSAPMVGASLTDKFWVQSEEETGLPGSMVLFLSDNGCPHRFGFCNPDHPFGAGKFTYLEGGVRVPFVFSWPAGLKTRGISASPVSSLDIAATVLRAADPAHALPRAA